MRLLRIRLRDFRGVHDREVTLAEDGVTVLQGENEVGKTSTVQALDLLVDVRDSSRRADVKAAAPAGVDAGPDVEAEIVSGPYRFVYRKRWLRRPLSELRVLEPSTEQLTGADAHARVNAILDETMDRDLWRALRVDQHAPVGQAELGGYGALARALDRAAAAGGDEGGPGGDGGGDGGPGGGGDEDADARAAGLVESAEVELRRYRTPTGRSTGELRVAEERVAAARAEHERCRRAIDAVEQDVAVRDRLDSESRDLERRRAEHRARVTELEDAWGALQSRLQEVDAARERAVATQERAAAADERRRARAALAAQLDAAADELTRADARRAEHEGRHAALRDDRAARHAEHRGAREEAARARRTARDADDALMTARDHADLAELDDALRRIADAEEGLRGAERELAAITVDQGAVDALDELSRDVVRAEAARDAGSASVEVLASEDAAAPEVLLDGEPTALIPGATRRLPVHGPVTVTVPGRVEVRVRPGHDGRALAEAVTRATDALAAACADAGVADLPAARAALRRADDAARRRTEHRAALDRELAGRDAGELRAAHDQLRARLDDRPSAPAITDPTVLRDRADEARGAADTAATRVEESDRLRAAADDAVGAADTEAALLAQRAADARHAHDRRAADLADARAEHPDQHLADDAHDRHGRAREARTSHEALAAALAAADPDTAEARVVNAREVDRRLADEADDLMRRRSETTGRLQSAGLQGWHDQLVTAETELEAATHEHRAADRRARAAERLHGVLVRHRDALRKAYVAPFRTEVERLARIVFGPTLALEVDPTLRITHRTLDGVTVPFDELSSGAKEQLALCARLACATLVDPADGVPVVIDDALGFTDPERLDRLGAVFTAATRGGAERRAQQVVVLTCTPERYRGVGAATVVSLAPSRPPARPAPGPEGAVIAAPPRVRGVAGDVGDDPPEHRLPTAG